MSCCRRRGRACLRDITRLPGQMETGSQQRRGTAERYLCLDSDPDSARAFNGCWQCLLIIHHNMSGLRKRLAAASATRLQGPVCGEAAESGGFPAARFSILVFASQSNSIQN
jgi:hypothetical protein